MPIVRPPITIAVNDLGRAIFHGAIKHGRDGRGSGGLAGYLEINQQKKKLPKRKEATR